MKNSEYWANRMRILDDSLLDTSYDYVQNLEKQYDIAIAELDKKISAWYQRFMVNNELSYSDAKKLLNSSELEEFKWTVEQYINHGIENGISLSWKKQLENASARVHISRLESLKVELRQQAELLHGSQLKATEDLLGGIYREGYYHTAFEVQKGLGFGWSMQSLNAGTIKKVLARSWTTDGQTFRDRCWTNKEALVNSVNTQLTQMIIRGEAPDKAIKAIAHQFEVSKSKAGRLVMTESAAFSSAAQKDCFNELGVEEYKIVETLDNETCPLCGALDGKVFKMSEYEVGTTAPPFHPWCRGCTAPYFADMEDWNKIRSAKDENGKTFTVDGNTTYKEWSKKAFNNSGKSNENAKSPFTNGENRDIIKKNLSYEDWEKADTALTAEAENWEKTLSNDERGCAIDYTSTAYEDINAWLRDGMEYSDDRLENLVNNIDNSIKSFDLKQNLSVIRGTSIEALQRMGININNAVGQIYWDPAYISASISKDIALDFALDFASHSGGAPALIQFDIPAGKGRGAYVETITANPGEKEFIIPRETEFEIYESIQNENGLLLKARWKNESN